MADYRKSYGKETHVKCRICKKELLLQNYKEHIRTQHVDEDCNDLRSLSQESLKSIFTQPLLSKTKKQKLEKIEVRDDTIEEGNSVDGDNCTKDTNAVTQNESLNERLGEIGIRDNTFEDGASFDSDNCEKDTNFDTQNNSLLQIQSSNNISQSASSKEERNVILDSFLQTKRNAGSDYNETSLKLIQDLAKKMDDLTL